MSQKIRSYNNLSWFKDVNKLQQLKNYIQNNIIPNLNNRQRNIFLSQFNSPHWILENNHIYYRPSDRINLRVVEPTENKGQLLQQIYNDDRRGLSLGLNKFYQQIELSYIGITKIECQNWLKKMGNYQISRTPKKNINKPVIAKSCNQRWQLDTIHLLNYPNNGYKYILSVIDIFSKYVFARALKNLRSETVMGAFHSIIHQDCNGLYPYIVQSDNGSEFADAFHQYLLTHNVKHIYSLPSTPTSNAYIERCNLELRRRIKAGFIKYNNFLWRVHLPDYVKNINNQPNRNKIRPVDIWQAGYQPQNNNINVENINDEADNQEIKDYVQTHFIKITKNKLNDNNLLVVNDPVRIAYNALSDEFRAANKNQLDRKRLIVLFTVDIYFIYRVYRPRRIDVNNQVFENNILNNTMYAVRTGNNDVLITDNGRIKKFFRNELMRIDPNTIDTPLTEQNAIHLNKF
jgi:transposase InsO family protein